MEDPLTLAQLDSLCDAFESEWQRCGKARMEDYWDRAGPALRERLQGELLRTEIQLRACAGDRPSHADYRGRLHSDIVELAFGFPEQLERFRLVRLLGQGAFGVVYEAEDPVLQRPVALKELNPVALADPRKRERFTREADIALGIKDANVVEVYEARLQGVRPFLVMELVDGVPLDGFIEATSPVPLERILRIGIDVARGLAAIHEHGIVHRDLKPANILLARSTLQAKISDFGLAFDPNRTALTSSHEQVGTAVFMSPEQAAGDPVDHRSDVFSLGSVLYLLCTRKRPFDGYTCYDVIEQVRRASPSRIGILRNDLPLVLVHFIERLHALRPLERPQSAIEIATVLQHILAVSRGPVPAPAEWEPILPGGGRMYSFNSGTVIAVVGHTDHGKTTTIRSITRKAIGSIIDRARVTTETELVTHPTILATFMDCPGFEAQAENILRFWY